MGLRDQLLKAGLVSKKQVNKAQAAAKKTEHDAKKNKHVGEELEAQKAAELEAIEKEKLAKKEHDKQLNLEREAARQAKEDLYRCLQLLRSNRLNEHRAQIPYFFLEQPKYVRKVLVTAYQREMLARGKYAIARPHAESDDFVIIPAHTAATILRLAPEKLILQHQLIDDNIELDDKFV